MIEHSTKSKASRRREARFHWKPELIKALREHMGLTQRELAEQLEVRQQTISEWETGLHTPHRSTQKVLTMLAERSSFAAADHSNEHLSDYHVEHHANGHAVGTNGTYAGAYSQNYSQPNGHINHGVD